MSTRNIALDTNYIKTKKVPPDGGWGWIVVGAFSFYFLVLFPILMNFGLIFKDKMIELQMGATDVAIIQNICSAFGSAIGLLSAPFIKRYGCRPVAFFASIFFCSGFMLSGIANSFITFLLAYSIITSFGIGFGWSSLYIAMMSYFDVHRDKASALSMTIAAIGPIIFPPIITILLKFYGSDGCIWILSAFSLNIFVASLLLQPVEWHMKRVEICDTEMELLNAEKLTDPNEIVKNNQQTTSRQISVPEDGTDYASKQSSRKESRKLSLQLVSDTNDSPSQFARKYSIDSVGSLHHARRAEVFNEALYNRRESKRSSSQHLSQSKIDEEELSENNGEHQSSKTEPTKSNKKSENIFRRCFNWLVKEFDLTLFKDVVFLNTLIGICLADFGEINFMLITPMVLDELNFDLVQVASLMSATAITDVIFRFLSPFIGEFLRQSPRLMFIHGLIVFIFARLAIIMATGYEWAMFGSILLGIGRSVYTVYWNLVVPNCIPIERLPSAMGIIMVSNGFLLMTTGPIVGVLRDITGNYTSSIHMINFTTILAITFWSIEIIYRHLKEKRKKNPKRRT